MLLQTSTRQIFGTEVATWHEIEIFHPTGNKPSCRFFRDQQIAEDLVTTLQREKVTWKKLKLESREVEYGLTSPNNGREVETRRKVKLCSVEKYWNGPIQEIVKIDTEDYCILPKYVRDLILKIRMTLKGEPGVNLSASIPGLYVKPV